MALLQEKNRNWLLPVLSGWEYNLRYCLPWRRGPSVRRAQATEFM
jgi:hypothetical protein